MGLVLGVLLELLEDCQRAGDLPEKAVIIKVSLKKVSSASEWLEIPITSVSYNKKSQSIVLNTHMQMTDLEEKNGEIFYDDLIFLEKKGLQLNTPVQILLEEYLVVDDEGTTPIFGKSFSIVPINEIYATDKAIVAHHSTDNEGFFMLILRRFMGKK